MKNDRFVKTYTQGALSAIEIWVDRATGINYLFRHDGYAGGLTVLLDSSGEPLVTPIEPPKD